MSLCRVWGAALLMGGLLSGLPALGGDLAEVTVRVEGARVTAEVAATPEGRATGLSGRDHLGRNRGMLFLWDDSAPRRFWMKGTHIPLSVAFLDARGRILNIQRMAPPSGEPAEGYRRYPSRGPARFALEVNRGWFAERGIGVGARCHFRVPADIAGSELVVNPPERP